MTKNVIVVSFFEFYFFENFIKVVKLQFLCLCTLIKIKARHSAPSMAKKTSPAARVLSMPSRKRNDVLQSLSE